MIRTLAINIGKLFFRRKELPEHFNPKKIIILRTGSLGDVLMTTPLLTTLRKHYKDATIDYAVGKFSKEVLDNNPNLNQLITYDDDIITKRKIGEINRLKNRIKERNYDLAIILDKSWLWNLFATSCNIPVRIGFDRNGEGFPNTLSIPFNGDKYELECNNDILLLLNI